MGDVSVKAGKEAGENKQMNGMSGSPLVVDLGKRKRKQVRALRRGEGPLMDDVLQTIDQLKASGTVNGDVLPVIVVIRQKPNRGFFRM